MTLSRLSIREEFRIRAELVLEKVEKDFEECHSEEAVGITRLTGRGITASVSWFFWIKAFLRD